ncbi:hypothetical protein B0H14DRAFT_3520177 [Mycena olivaceomarginata]|nr:hypothetical protein B0H14DRAFT_3520177 [Mycena olivaceomarginata]
MSLEAATGGSGGLGLRINGHRHQINPHSSRAMSQLIGTLSLVHIASGLYCTGSSQFIAILYAINTFYMLSRLCFFSFRFVPHGTQKDTDPVSRLKKQYVIVNFLLLFWVFSSAPLFLSILTLPAQNGPTNRRRQHHPHPHALRARLFITPKSLTLGLDMALPLALVGTRACPSPCLWKRVADLSSSLRCVTILIHSLPVPAPHSGHDLIHHLPRHLHNAGRGCPESFHSPPLLPVLATTAALPLTFSPLLNPPRSPAYIPLARRPHVPLFRASPAPSPSLGETPWYR